MQNYPDGSTLVQLGDELGVSLEVYIVLNACRYVFNTWVCSVCVIGSIIEEPKLHESESAQLLMNLSKIVNRIQMTMDPVIVIMEFIQRFHFDHLLNMIENQTSISLQRNKRMIC